MTDRFFYKDTINDGTLESLLQEIESSDLSGLSLAQIQVLGEELSNQYSEKFEAFLDFKEEQANILENRLEQMSLKQQQILNSLESNKPGILASPKKRSEYQAKLAACQQRRITIEARIDRIKDIRVDLENASDGFKKGFEHNLAAKNDNWFNNWKDESILVSKLMKEHQEIQKQIKLQKEQKKKAELKIKAPTFSQVQKRKLTIGF